MLLSMTGFGEAAWQSEQLAVSVEIRATNHRYLKLTTRLPEGYAALEPAVEATVRRSVRRGSIQVTVRATRHKPAAHFRIDEEVLLGYYRQLEAFCTKWGLEPSVSPELLLQLPGVAGEDPLCSSKASEDWPVIEKTLQTALEKLNCMRTEEGRAMAADLAGNCRTLGRWLDEVAQRAPAVVESYRQRLQERLGQLLAELNVSASEADIVREVGLFADRCDISEEIVRLQSHLEQFHSLLDAEESSGRKLEFLVQEMLREVNTIGSKANDTDIARLVVEMKAAVERMREVLQNVE